MLKKEDLDQIKNLSDEWCVSLFLPVNRDDLQINRTRLKKLMFEAEKRLLELGMPILTVAEMLMPIERILDRNSFWTNQMEGLALFLTPNSFNWYSLPFKSEETVIVSNKFFLKPMKSANIRGIKTKIQNLIRSKTFSQLNVQPVGYPAGD